MSSIFTKSESVLKTSFEKNINGQFKQVNKTLSETNKFIGVFSSSFNGDASKKISGINDELLKVSKTTSEASGFMERFGAGTLAVAAGQFAFNALSSAIGSINSSISESIAAFADQEDAINKLNQSLNMTGNASQSSVDGVISFASSLEKTSRFSDDAVIGQIAFARSLGASTEQSKQLVQAAANLSATLGGSLEENVDKLGKTLSGTAGRLGQYIPELKNLTEEELKAGRAAEIINSKFSGAAAKDLETYSGQMASLANSYNNAQETLGELIAKNATFSGIIKAVKSRLDDFNDSQATSAALENNAIGSSKASSRTREQLANDYQTLDDRIKSLNTRYEELRKQEEFAGLAASNTITLTTKNQITQLEAAKTAIEERLKFDKLSTPQDKKDNASTVQSDEALNAISKKNAEIAALNAQAALDERNFKEQQSILLIEDEYIRQQAELERIASFNEQKAVIDAENKIKQAEASLTGNALNQEQLKINKEKELAINKSYTDKFVASATLASKKEIEIEKNRKDQIKKIDDELVKNKSDTFATIATLASSNNKTLAVIGKAAALTQIAIDGPVAVGKALAAFPPPFNFAAAAAVGTAVAAQAARVAGVQFEQGGIVGAPQGVTGGADNRVATIKDGELILNGQQQKNLLDMINNGSGGGDIIIKIDEREIARAVRSQKQQGFVI